MAAPTMNHDSSSAWEYDVFLSFRGENTRKTFIDHLYCALSQAGIRTFRDEEELRKGKELDPELMRAIQRSRISLIVFSKDYASSRWCLDELLQILECKEKGKQIIFPIFYDVKPSQVRKQSGDYGVAFAKHEERYRGSDKVHIWRDALTKVANMSGWDLRDIANGYESKFINAIIKEVQSVVRHVPMFVVKHGVGLDSRVEHVVQLLHREPNDDVRMIGIYGMGGIGKTTLAKAVYNRFFEYFEKSCFLEIESAISGQHNNGINLEKVNKHIKNLQKMLFRKLFNEEIEVCSVGEGIMLMQKRLQARKCLIVLDNLEHINQFNALCGERNWFGGGSILILTTRDAHLLKNLNDEEHYEVKILNHEESLHLFSLHALPKEDCIELLDGIVAYCGGLPLALEVLGAYLSDKSREEWISAFEKLKKIPNNDVQAKLKISYDGLSDDYTKSFFLDLVCFDNGIPKETIDTMGYFSTIEIRNLVDKCLINCQRFWISMHSLIREMGREIIRLESPNNPEERSRLWCAYDIHDVLIGRKGTKKIEVIVLNSPKKNMKYSTKAFKNMKNLRFLQIDEVHLEGNFKNLFKVLRCLRWNNYPLKYIPTSCVFDKLVRLEMQQSNMKNFRAPLEFFPCLESLDLARSRRLKKTPKFSGAQNLRRLSFSGCNNLVKMHSSIGELGRLEYLNFRECTKLKKLPNSLCKLSSLQFLDVSFAPKLYALPKHFGNLTSIQKLHLLETNIFDLPPNLPHLLRLESICLNLYLQVFPKLPHSVEKVIFFGCENLQVIQELPPNLKGITLKGCQNLKFFSKLPSSLREISIEGCQVLKLFPELPPNLMTLILHDCASFKMLPEFPPSLWGISLNGCKNLKILPELPHKLISLRARNCESIEKIPNLSSCTGLQVLDLTGCRKLKEIQGLENLHSIRELMLGGVPHANFSESIKESFFMNLKTHTWPSSSVRILNYSEIGPTQVRQQPIHNISDSKISSKDGATPKKRKKYELHDSEQSSFTSPMLRKKVEPITRGRLLELLFSSDKEKNLEDLVVFPQESLKCSGMYTLRPGNWVREDVINTAACMIRYKNDDPSTSYLPTYFASSILEQERMDLYLIFNEHVDKDLVVHTIYIPMNKANMHWYLVKADLKNKVAHILDSFYSKNIEIDRITDCRKVIRELHTCLIRWATENKGFSYDGNFEEWKYKFDTSVPRQNNGDDCGVFVILFMEHGDSLRQDMIIDTDHERERIALELIDHPFNSVRDNVNEILHGHNNKK